MKKIARILTFVLVLVLSSVVFSACGKYVQNDKNLEEVVAPVNTEEPKITETPKSTEAPTITEAPISTQAPTNTGEPMVIRDISSFDLVKEMKIGWNLGNTFDATGGSGIGAETSWGNPKTTKEMIDKLKSAGFNVIRIPITWGGHLGEAPDYIIEEEWLDRVQEVVDYAVQDDMFVIVNLHHEDWHFPSYDNLEPAKAKLTKVWEQVAKRFKGYNEYLIFEGMNEPRKFGTNVEWTGGDDESRDVINQLNATFIETVRKSGGNNLLRHLMIPGYAASSDKKVLDDLIVPKDDKIIISIHAYTPYNFALNESGTSEFSSDNLNDTRDVDNLFDSLADRFISNNIPVIIGEYGARNKGNLDARVDWAEYYIKKASEKGIPCVWWDNGAFTGNGENFGLLNRRLLKWEYPELVEALMKGLND